MIYFIWSAEWWCWFDAFRSNYLLWFCWYYGLVDIL